MKAMILAAGFGERMRPLTLTTPKPLIKVRGEALIDHHLHALQKAQISEVAINVHHLGDQIIAHVTQRFGDVFQLHFFKEAEILGTGGGVYQALSVLGNAPFMVISADIFTDYPYEKLPRYLTTKLAHLVMVDNPAFHPNGDFFLNTEGLLTLTEGIPLTYGNIGVFHPHVFASGMQGKFEMRDVLIPAIKAGKISAEYYPGNWENVGTIAQLEALNVID